MMMSKENQIFEDEKGIYYRVPMSTINSYQYFVRKKTNGFMTLKAKKVSVHDFNELLINKLKEK